MNSEHALKGLSTLSRRLVWIGATTGIALGFLAGLATQLIFFPDSQYALPYGTLFGGALGLATGLGAGIVTFFARIIFAPRPRSKNRVVAVVTVGASVSFMAFFWFLWIRPQEYMVPLWTIPILGLLAAVGGHALASRTISDTTPQT